MWTALSLALRLRKYGGLDEFDVHFFGLEGHPPHRALVAAAPTLRDVLGAVRDAIGMFLAEFGEPAMICFDVGELRGCGTSGVGLGHRFREMGHCGNVELDVGDAEDALEATGYDKMAKVLGDVFGFGGHVTRDWGLGFWEPERGLDKFMLLERS